MFGQGRECDRGVSKLSDGCASCTQTVLHPGPRFSPAHTFQQGCAQHLMVRKLQATLAKQLGCQKCAWPVNIWSAKHACTLRVLSLSANGAEAGERTMLINQVGHPITGADFLLCWGGACCKGGNVQPQSSQALCNNVEAVRYRVAVVPNFLEGFPP